jgi:hypothetical protein
LTDKYDFSLAAGRRALLVIGLQGANTAEGMKACAPGASSA